MARLIMAADQLTEDELGGRIGLSGKRVSDLFTGEASADDQTLAFPRLSSLFRQCRIRLMPKGLAYTQVGLHFAPNMEATTPAELKSVLNQALGTIGRRSFPQSFDLRVRSVPLPMSQSAVGFCEGDAESTYFLLFQNAARPGTSTATTIKFLEFLQEYLSTNGLAELEAPRSSIFALPSSAWWPSESQIVDYGAWTSNVLSDAGYFLGHGLKLDASALEVDLSTASRYRTGQVRTCLDSRKKRVVDFCDSCLPQLRTKAAPFHRLVHMPEASNSSSTLDYDEAQILLLHSLQKAESAFPPPVAQSGELDVHLQCVDLPEGIPLLIFKSAVNGVPKLFIILVASTIQFSKAVQFGLRQLLRVVNDGDNGLCPPFTTRILAT